MTASRIGIRAAATLVALAAGLAAGAVAQDTTMPAAGSAAACPVAGGVVATVTVRDSGRAAPRELLHVDRRTAVDTAFTFNVAERRWTFAELGASVAAGLSDTTGSRWYLCAGAAVGLRQPTIVVRGARGQVRLRASLRNLTTAPPPARPSRDPRTPPTRS